MTVLPITTHPTMTDRKHLIQIGRAVKAARERLRLTQVELGQALFADKVDQLNPKAIQSRINRIEKGKAQLPPEQYHRLFNLLAITKIDPHTLAPRDDDYLPAFHTSILLRYPEVKQYIHLINAAAQKNDYQAVRELMRTLAGIIDRGEDTAEENKQIAGDPNPFAQGGKRK